MEEECRELGYRLGLKPFELERTQPVELWDMEEGRRWLESRDAERWALAVMVIANRIPFNKEGVKYRDLVRAICPEYEE